MFKAKFIDGSNNFKERCLNEMIQLLDNGDKIEFVAEKVTFLSSKSEDIKSEINEKR